MVSAKALLSLYAISGIVHSYPMHRHIEDPHHLPTRLPHPRFRNPFDVDSYLKNLDYEIPNNQDIQEWVKEARKKGALAAEGKFSGEDDEDEDEDHDNDHDDDDEDQHSTEARPRVSEEGDDHDDDEDDHDQQTANSAPGPNDDGLDEDDEDDEDEDADDHENANSNEAAQPIQSVQPSRPETTHRSSTPTTTSAITASNADVLIPSPTQESNDDETENNIEVIQPVQSVQPSQPTSTADSCAPTATPSSTAASADAPSPQPVEETENNDVMQPNNAQDSATPTITPSNTISDGDDGADATVPPAQTVYVPVNVFPTRIPNYPDIDDEENPSSSSTPLPIFPPPEDITKANLPPAAVLPSPEQSTDTNDPEVSEALGNQDMATTPDVTANTGVTDAPVYEEPASDNIDSTTNTYTPRPQMPSHEAQFSKISELLDMFTPKDQSEESY